MHDLKKFFWDDLYLYWSFVNGIIRRCVPEVDMFSVLVVFHSSLVGRHNSGIRTADRIMHCGYYWQTINQNAHDFAKSSNRCQRDGGI